ncbi:unnamed protein product, partial [marine sediment metagenome]
HARFEPSGMTSNKDIPFAKSLIDYIFCWLGCQFIPGYEEKNTPNRAAPAGPAESKNVTTAKQLVEKTKDLTRKIAEAKAGTKPKSKHEEKELTLVNQAAKPAEASPGRFAGLMSRIGTLVGSTVTGESGEMQSEAKVLEQFNTQFGHFQDDAPACDICGAITVRNGMCYRCYNCGNSMGCS